MANAQIRDLTDEQLAHQVLKAERDLVALKFRLSMSQLENTSTIGNIRKQIARLKTEARQRETVQGLAKDSLIASYGKTFAKGKGSSEGGDQSGGFLSGIVDKLSSND